MLRSFLHQDKGHSGEWEAFVAAVKNGTDSPIPFREIVSTMLATFALEESRCVGQPVAVTGLRQDHRAPETDGFDGVS